MEIVWTEPAKADLKRVYRFNTKLMGEEKAWDLVQGIVSSVEKLLSRRIAGDMPDHQFSHLGKDFRKILLGNHKVTFRRKGNEVVVLRVFDMRRHPDKNL